MAGLTEEHPEFVLLFPWFHTWEQHVLSGLQGYSKDLSHSHAFRETKQHALAVTLLNKLGEVLSWDLTHRNEFAHSWSLVSQVLLSDYIRSESLFCNITTVSRWQAQSMGALVNPSFSECYVSSFSRLDLFGEQIAVHYRILFLPCIVTVMNPMCWEIISLSCGFIYFSNTTEFCLCSRFLEFSNAGFGELSFTWCRRSRWFLQLSPCILNEVFVIFVAWINRKNSPRISGIFQLWVFRQPILAFLFFELLFQFSSKRQAICDLDVMSFEFLSISPRTTTILLEEFRSIA